MKLFKKINYLTVIKYACIFGIFAAVNAISVKRLPVSVSIFAAFLYFDFPIIQTAAVFIAALVVTSGEILTETL